MIPVDFSQGSPITYFLCGSFATVFAASGLIFLKYWKKTRDRFFLWFAVACCLIAVERIPRAFQTVPAESANLLYLIRLAAMILIIFAIVDANRSKPKRPAP